MSVPSRSDPNAAVGLPALSSALLDAINSAILLLAWDGTITQTNGSALTMLGYEKLEGKNLAGLFPRQDMAEEFLRRIAARTRKGSSSLGRTRLRRAGGDFVPVSYRASRLDVGGREVVLLDTVDLRVENEQDQQTRSLARFSDENPFPILRVADDGTLLYANPGSWLLLAHWNVERGQRVPLEWTKIIQQVLASEDSREVETQIGFKTLLLSLVPVPEMGYVDIFGLDVTNRKQAERKLQLDAQVFENATEGVMITDAEQRILDVNRAFTTITGYTREEILGENASILQSGRHDESFYRELWKSVRERGSWQGEIWDRRKNGDIYPKRLSISAVPDERGQVVRYIGLFSDITTVKQTQEQLYHMANYDSLTGLANRRFFHDRLGRDLQEARRSGEMVALMFIDLDGFKLINDNMGHRAGDVLLRAAADRIRENVRDSDTVARMGGDEFTVVIPRLHNSQHAAGVAQKMLARIAEPVALEQQEIFTTSSIGIAIFPQDAADVEGLLQSADTALYRAKERGKNGCQFYSRDMNTAAVERLQLSLRLRHGFEAGELHLHYQPMVSAATGRVTCLEALARWESAGEGAVSPEVFIPLAEETGLIHDLGAFLLRRACEQGKRWHRDFGKGLRIAVNISPYQLRRSDFLSRVERIVEEAGFPFASLEFELTEGSLQDDLPEISGKLERLKSLGATISLDDFGTRSSSLSSLKRFPIDRLKIDRSFIRDIPHDANSVEIASAILGMGRSLNLAVVAEGVQTEEQAALLRSQGCDAFQGSLFSQPRPPQELHSYLKSTCCDEEEGKGKSVRRVPGAA
jgi:diguanylate cyclase (GGDEF)-like protein/PAS domain S-box-containing protein